MWRATMRYSAVGLEMGIAIGVCVGVGWWLGGRYGHKTAFLLGGLGLGIAVATRAVVRVAQMGLKEARDDSDDSNDGNDANGEHDNSRERQDDDRKP